MQERAVASAAQPQYAAGRTRAGDRAALSSAGAAGSRHLRHQGFIVAFIGGA